MNFIKKASLMVSFGLLFAVPASAALPTIVPPCATGTDTPSLQCFLMLLSNVAKWILGISGGLALLFFIYGGFMFLTSRGNENQIAKGKEILSKAVIGVIIIFGAYFAVDFLTRTVLQANMPKAPEGPLTEQGKDASLLQSTSTIPEYKSENICTCVCSDGYSETVTTSKTPPLTAQQVCEQECSFRTPLSKPPKVVTMTSCK